METGNVRSITLPAPVGGLNSRDPDDLMPETDAIRLCNWFPDGNVVSIRRGSAEHNSGVNSSSVQTLAEYSGPTGTRKLLGAGGGAIFDCSTSGAAGTSLGTGFSVNKWQTTNFRGVQIWVNGTDQPQQFNGTALSSATYTGTGLTDNDLITVAVYKARLYFVEKNTASYWYGDVNNITGALLEEDIGGQLTLGGYLLFAGALSKDTGRGLEDMLAVVSNMGEVLLYEGDYPGASNWARVARYFLPGALDRRGYLNIGSDLIVMTENGFISLSELISSDGRMDQLQFSSKVHPLLQRDAQNYRTNFGWCGVMYPRGHYALFNVPIASDSKYDQYVMNTLTRGWTKFSGMNGSCWCLFNDKLYFGGANGRVYLADTGGTDSGANIETDMKTVFHYCGDRESNKLALMARPICYGEKDARFVFDVDADFQNKAITATIDISGQPGSAWDTSPWDSSPWEATDSENREWYSVSAYGRCFAFRMSASVSDVEMSMSAIQFIYEPAGVL